MCSVTRALGRASPDDCTTDTLALFYTVVLPVNGMYAGRVLQGV